MNVVLDIGQFAEEMKPHPIVVNVLTQLSKIIPTWKLIPTQDIIDIAIKNPEWREQVSKGQIKLLTSSFFLLSPSKTLSRVLTFHNCITPGSQQSLLLQGEASP